jgi:recombination protein RecR
MDRLHKLERLFTDFPGIGPRQAKRFAFFLLSKDSAYISNLISLMSGLKQDIATCTLCFRFFPKNKTISKLCPTCSNASRNTPRLMVVARDIDFENIEKADEYDGFYFLLGGVMPILEKDAESRIRIKELIKRIEADGKIRKCKEIILAFNANPEGENTTEFVRERISPLCKEYGIKISTLGRGLSTGLELEYSDAETLKNALKNRA